MHNELFLNKFNKWPKDGLVMSIYHHEHNRRLVAPLDRAQLGEAVLATARSLKRLVPKWGSEIFLGFLIAAAAMGLASFATHVSKQDQKLADADKPGEGMLLRIEIVRVWLPSALVELVKHEPPTGVIRTHEDLRRLLELRGQENVWYAMNVRGYHDDGLIVVIPYVRRPYSEPQFFPELLEILAKAAGNSPGDPTDRFMATVVSLLPESFLKRDPRDAAADLLDDISPSLNAERVR
jgi:hypothetical protein